MKLYIETESNGREYLPHTAQNRTELAQKLGTLEITVSGRLYHIKDVKAEAYQLVLRATLIVAGAMTVSSLFAVMVVTSWPAIAFVSAAGGVLAGIYLASRWQQSEDQAVKIFNRSRIHSESGIQHVQAA